MSTRDDLIKKHSTHIHPRITARHEAIASLAAVAQGAVDGCISICHVSAYDEGVFRYPPRTVNGENLQSVLLATMTALEMVSEQLNAIYDIAWELTDEEMLELVGDDNE